MTSKSLILLLSLSFFLGIIACGIALAHGDHGTWRSDPRRPAGTPTLGGDPGRVDWWHVDARRPALWPWGETSRDSDRDGVNDSADRCPDTPMGATVDVHGCPKDSDGDGVHDGIDQCPETPRGVQVDDRGCAIVSGKEAELLDTGTLRLENVYFETNQAVLKSESFASLNEAGEILTRWSRLRIEVGGHTDSQGEADYNLALSQRRANAVRNYLLANFSSITKRQLVAKGYGETHPIAENTTASGRAKNRRVELEVLNRKALRR